MVVVVVLDSSGISPSRFAKFVAKGLILRGRQFSHHHGHIVRGDGRFAAGMGGKRVKVGHQGVHGILQGQLGQGRHGGSRGPHIAVMAVFFQNNLADCMLQSLANLGHFRAADAVVIFGILDRTIGHVDVDWMLKLSLFFRRDKRGRKVFDVTAEADNGGCNRCEVWFVTADRY